MIFLDPPISGISEAALASFARRAQKLARVSGEVSILITGKDRKSTRLNSSHLVISYAVFCLKKKKNIDTIRTHAQNPATQRVLGEAICVDEFGYDINVAEVQIVRDRTKLKLM